MLPLVNDVDEAQAVHELLLEQTLAQNAVLAAHPESLKQCITRISQHAAAHTEKEEDILGEKGKGLMQQVLQQM